MILKELQASAVNFKPVIDEKLAIAPVQPNWWSNTVDQPLERQVDNAKWQYFSEWEHENLEVLLEWERKKYGIDPNP